MWYFGSFGVAELLGALLLYQTGNLATTKDFALSDKFILVFPPNNGISHEHVFEIQIPQLNQFQIFYLLHLSWNHKLTRLTFWNITDLSLSVQMHAEFLAYMDTAVALCVCRVHLRCNTQNVWHYLSCNPRRIYHISPSDLELCGRNWLLNRKKKNKSKFQYLSWADVLFCTGQVFSLWETLFLIDLPGWIKLGKNRCLLLSVMSFNAATTEDWQRQMHFMTEA